MPPLEVIPLEFRPDFWRHKIRVHGLSYGVVCVILDLAIFVELGLRLVTDMSERRAGKIVSCRYVKGSHLILISY